MVQPEGVLPGSRRTLATLVWSEDLQSALGFMKLLRPVRNELPAERVCITVSNRRAGVFTLPAVVTQLLGEGCVPAGTG